MLPEETTPRRPARPTAESLVELRISTAEKSADAFKRTLVELKRLKQEVQAAYRATVISIVKLAVAYNAAYLRFQRDGDRVKRLNLALGITDQMATRWRHIADDAPFVKRNQKVLPASPESLYEIIRAREHNPEVVSEAIDKKGLTADSTQRECKALRARANSANPDDDDVLRYKAAALHTMKNVQFRLTFSQDRVLRVDELAVFRQRVETVLRETFEDISLIECGASEGGRWLSGWDLENRLKTYWNMTDGTNAIKSENETADTPSRTDDVATNGEDA